MREAITASGANAHIGEVFNTNALLAEALHHRLADAGLARADRVRMFSITTSADGIILATVGGEEAVGTASVTAFLLAARLALPVMAASLDAKPSIEEAAAQLEGMGVTRIALAPCVIGPEADPAAIEEAAAVIGAKCCAPLGAHGNVVKLISLAYGQVLNQLEAAGPDARSARRADGTDKAAGRVHAVDADEGAGVRGVHHHAVADVDGDVVDRARVGRVRGVEEQVTALELARGARAVPLATGTRCSAASWTPACAQATMVSPEQS